MRGLTGLRWVLSRSYRLILTLHQAILTNARRMRGSYVETGGSRRERESSAPYPAPRVGSNPANNQLDGSPLSGFSNQRVPTTGAMSSIPLDGLEFMGRAPSLPGASSRPAGAQMAMPGSLHQRAPPMPDVKMAGIRPSLPTTRPSSANSVAGQVGNIANMYKQTAISFVAFCLVSSLIVRLLSHFTILVWSQRTSHSGPVQGRPGVQL